MPAASVRRRGVGNPERTTNAERVEGRMPAASVRRRGVGNPEACPGHRRINRGAESRSRRRDGGDGATVSVRAIPKRAARRRVFNDSRRASAI